MKRTEKGSRQRCLRERREGHSNQAWWCNSLSQSGALRIVVESDVSFGRTETGIPSLLALFDRTASFLIATCRGVNLQVIQLGDGYVELPL